VAAARDQALAMLEERSGPFADAASCSAWRWNRAWPAPSGAFEGMVRAFLSAVDARLPEGAWLAGR
jgi:hypothetical protein